ncbi:LysR family transcriptional regulator [Pseudomonas sp. NFXW11]|uniref:LysR family transcriptional regulator n=1 Tax=Pseudomonas sp. NFXW11 TaxID=2819531 RepID=UPI003CF3CE57
MIFDEQLLRKIDLNSLVTFMVIYQEQNVSRAAQRLSVTQPAVSNSLRELRYRFEDPLFIPRCRHMEPTPLARHIAEMLEPAMQLMQLALRVLLVSEKESANV